jgi:transcriptional regulator with XRE-family HTH domain
MGTAKDKLKSILSKRKSTWMKDATWRKDNDFWIETSQQIAIRILFELEKIGMTQVELAGLLKMYPQQVNKIIKGTENLTLETIRRIEVVLNIKLVSVVDSGLTFKEQSIDVVNNRNKQYAGIIEKLRGIKKIAIKYEVVKVSTSSTKTAIKMKVKEPSQHSQYEAAA